MTDEQYNDLRGLVEQNSAETTEIRKAIVGDPELGHRGLAVRVSDNETDIASLNACKLKMVAWATGFSAAATGAGAWLISLFKASPPPGH